MRLKENTSYKERRIRNITNLYYSRKDVQKAIYDFSKHREICPRYFEGFGKRPDSFQYPSDVFEMAKNGATSFNCSEELWRDPMGLSTGMTEKQLSELRIGWDLIIDIDCKYFDFSKKAAASIINVFKNHGVKNIGVKFSGSRGFHIIIPWKSFPHKIGDELTKNLFPDLPKTILSYIRCQAEKEIRKMVSQKELTQFGGRDAKKGIKCNNCREFALVYELVNYVCPNCHRQELRKVFQKGEENSKCPDCKSLFEIKESKKANECLKCDLNSIKNPESFSKNMEIDLFSLMGLDLALASSRHLFRMPYSLHEKTALASVVVTPEKILNFDIKEAAPLKAEIKDFMPLAQEGEAERLTIEALDWAKENLANKTSDKKITGKYADFKPIKLKNIRESQFPPCIIKLLQGLVDGRKRAVFILINLFRSIGMDKDELERKIYDWNKKNKPPLNEGYIKTQLLWSYKKKPIMPPNFDSDYYKGIGLLPNIEEMNSKNPVNYIIKKNHISTKRNINKGK